MRIIDMGVVSAAHRGSPLRNSCAVHTELADRPGLRVTTAGGERGLAETETGRLGQLPNEPLW